MSVFDGYEDEALRDLATTLRRLSDGSVDEGDLVIVRDFLYMLVDEATVAVGELEEKGQEVLGGILKNWYVGIVLNLIADEIDKRVEA
jgi:hypothetical protein